MPTFIRWTNSLSTSTSSCGRQKNAQLAAGCVERSACIKDRGSYFGFRPGRLRLPFIRNRHSDTRHVWSAKLAFGLIHCIGQIRDQTASTISRNNWVRGTSSWGTDWRRCLSSPVSRGGYPMNKSLFFPDTPCSNSPCQGGLKYRLTRARSRIEQRFMIGSAHFHCTSWHHITFK